jgi:hypothetical protein
VNIKEHIEAGHYPKDDKGRALVPADLGGFAVIAATDAPGIAPMIGWWNDDHGTETQMAWREDGAWMRAWTADMTKCKPHLLPPPARKVKVTAYAVVVDGRHCPWAIYDTQAQAEQKARGAMQSGRWRIVELSGEYEEPWS